MKGKRILATAIGTTVLVTAGLFAMMSVPSAGALLAARAGSTVAATGGFDEYSSGPALGYTDVTGHAQLTRPADGRTLVTVEVHGLHPETSYAVHVHEGRCSDLGGHYFFDVAVPGGDGPGGDEIWPGPVATNLPAMAGAAPSWAPPQGRTARSVVVHATTSGGARIACADLS